MSEKLSIEQIQEWAEKRADDAGRLARELLPFRAHEARTVSEPDFEAMVAAWFGKRTGQLVSWHIRSDVVSVVELVRAAYAQGLAARPLPAETVEAIRTEVVKLAVAGRGANDDAWVVANRIRARIIEADLSHFARQDAWEATRLAAIEECARVLDGSAQEWNRIRDPGMANHDRKLARAIRALKPQDAGEAKHGIATGSEAAGLCETVTYTVAARRTDAGLWKIERVDLHILPVRAACALPAPCKHARERTFDDGRVADQLCKLCGLRTISFRLRGGP